MVENLYVLFGSALGFACGYFFCRFRALKEKALLQMQLMESQTRLSTLATGHQDQLKLLAEAEKKFSDHFRALSTDALQASQESFLKLAHSQFDKLKQGVEADLTRKQDLFQELVKPVRESLIRVDEKIGKLQLERARMDEALTQQLKHLSEAHHVLRSETAQLVTALRAPQARGRWGEMQLKRVVEMAGMVEYCDFETQISTGTEEGRLRPDLIVRLPGGKSVVVDAKTPLISFLEAVSEENMDVKKLKFTEHARAVRKHIEQLSRKSYWAEFQPTPEFVVLFLPGEAFFSAALEHDPNLIELGVTQNVIIATPTTLISLLRAVAYGWRQERLAENAAAIGELGVELYKRLSDTAGHLSKVGKSLEGAVDHYNKAIGSLESRVFVSARRFRDLDRRVSVDEIIPLEPLDRSARQLDVPELLPEKGPEALS